MSIYDANASTTCLYTTLRNISAHTYFFGFIPPHGRRLACGEEITVWGDIQHWLGRFYQDQRVRVSLENALAGDSPVLAIVSTPVPHLYDETLDQTQMLSLDNGVLTVADPCWGQYSSEAVC